MVRNRALVIFMAFTSSVTETFNMGSKKGVIGTWTNGASDTGGQIDTQLETTEGMLLTNKTSVGGNAPVINATFPSSNSITIVTDADDDGYFFAWGF